MTSRRCRGFTLIELMITIAIVGILAGLAAPSFQVAMANTKIRTAADTMQAGLQLARMEALRRNGRVTLWLVNGVTASCARSTTGTSWVVSINDPSGNCAATASDTASPRLVQSLNGNEGSSGVSVTASATNCVTFNGFGRVEATCFGGTTAALTRISLTSATSGTSPRDVRVSSGGAIKMCTPAITDANNPNFC
jgi:type IV fimbrial biogenesis protein FimT